MYCPMKINELVQSLIDTLKLAPSLVKNPSLELICKKKPRSFTKIEKTPKKHFY